MDEELHPASRYFDALSVYPRVRLDIQREDEQIILLIREHPVTQIPWVLNSLGLLLVLILLNLVLPKIFSFPQILFLNLFSLAAILSYIWLNFLRWYFQVGIVTNERILDIDFKSALYKEVAIARLSNVQEIASKSGGYINTLFNFGDIHVLTAGANVNIDFPNAPDPSFIIKLINQLSHRAGAGNTN